MLMGTQIGSKYPKDMYQRTILKLRNLDQRGVQNNFFETFSVDEFARVLLEKIN